MVKASARSSIPDVCAPGGSCDEGQVACDDGTCIPQQWQCDGRQDCAQAEDEMACHVSCSSDEFSCDLGECVSEEFRCDGDVDCVDASDEVGCNSTLTCDDTQFMCANAVECILSEYRCDGNPDCNDWSDEDYCTGYTCRSDEFRCPNSTFCISFKWKCDGVRNCPDGSDEDCSEAVSSCQMFVCDDRSQCLDYKVVCDGHVDCLDGSDEADNCSSVCREKRCTYGCTRTETGVACACPQGYVVDPEKQTHCKDLDECTAEPHVARPPCGQVCINTRGSYHCACTQPYSLEPDRRTCRMRHPDPVLLLSGPSDILMFNLRRQGSILETIQTGLNSVEDMDVDSRGRRVFWIDYDDRKIYFTKLTWENSLTDKPVYVNVGLVSPRALSYNWHADLLYVLDSFQGVIVACTVEGTACAVVVDGLRNRDPSDLLVDPVSRYLYWVENTHPIAIMRSDLDGRNRSAFLQAPMMRMDHLLIDYPARTLYWMDSALEVIYQIPLDAPPDNRIKFMRVFAVHGLHHPVALAVVEDWVLWAERKSGVVMRVNKWTGTERQRLVRHNSVVTGAVVLHPALQPSAGDNACWGAPCTQMCVESRNQNGYTCLCPPEMVLHSDGFTCKWVRTTPFLLAGTRSEILQIPSFNIGHINLRRLSPAALPGVTILDVNPITQQIVIGTRTEGGEPVAMISNSIWSAQFSVRVMEDRADYLGEPLSLAMDWAADQVFWLNGERSTVEIFKTNGQSHSRLSFPGVTDVKSIAINVTRGLLFYSTWGKQPGIVQCHMDGSNCSTIVSKKVRGPDHLLSFGDRLYWSDQRLGGISSVLYDGSQREMQVYVESPQQFALHQHLYYLDNATRIIHLYNLQEAVEVTQYHLPSMDIQDLVMLIPQHEVSDMPCSQDNGGCSDICVSVPERGRRCLCPLGKALAADQQTCQVSEKVCSSEQVLCLSSDTCVLKSDLCHERVHCQHLSASVQCLPFTPDSAEEEGKGQCLDDQCQQVCSVEDGTPVCSCHHGFYLNTDGITCSDVNECLVRNGNCSQLCDNNRGSYSCSCVQGYRLIGDMATCHSRDHDSAYLVVSTNSGFILVEMDGQKYYPVFMLTSTPLAFDLTIQDDWRLYRTALQSSGAGSTLPPMKTSFIWADASESRDILIKKTAGASIQELRSLLKVTVIRVDQVTQNVYFVGADGRRHSIVACDGQLSKCHTVLTGDDWQPSSLVFHPSKRMMFWNDLASHTIGAAFMDGTGRRTVVEGVISVPHGLSLCTVRGRLYWVVYQGPFRSFIHTARLDGGDRYTLSSVPYGFFTSMDMFEGFLFVTNNGNTHSLHKVSTFSRSIAAEMLQTNFALKDVRVVHSNPKVYNPCTSLGCSDLCLLSASGGKCVCPERVLLSTSPADCSHGPNTQSPPAAPRPVPTTPGQGPSSSLTAATHWEHNRPYPERTTTTPTPTPTPSPTHNTAASTPAGPSYKVCSDFCLNGAFCQIVNGKPKCLCDVGFSGTQCEVLVLTDQTPPVGEEDVTGVSDKPVVNVTLTSTPTPTHGLSPGAAVAIVIVILMTLGAVVVVVVVLYRRKRAAKSGYSGVEFRMESDEASLVPGGGHSDEFFYCKWGLDGSLLDTSGSSGDSAVYSSSSSPTPIYNPVPVFNPFNTPPPATTTTTTT
ncbi:uncharacterized protein LOC143276257 isoform X2 [Babylonia areolata]|uniref:uncharacterized protein LOC143276257 isoform X2 n=1 Tax=Babylonia areolata TaxID=304850 RepID=UPI003FD0BCA6